MIHIVLLSVFSAPGKPKFIEHLINRVVSKRVSRRNSNGLNTTNEEPAEVPEEPLSPDSEKCLQQAEAIVEELLSCSNRPVSGESTDSGKGSSLLESTSDFSPTSKRKSWSTPASPTFHGIVKERLRSFQILNESSDTDSVSSHQGVHSPIHKQRSFKNEEFDQEIREINQSIKQYYCTDSQDETFNAAVMEEGYVKALVAKINENKLKADPTKSASSEIEHVENGEGVSDDVKLKLKVDPEDSGWNEWEQEVGDDEGGTGEEVTEETENVEKRTSSSNSSDIVVDKRTSGSIDRKSKLSQHSDRNSDRNSNTSSGSSSSRANSQTNSVSDSDNHVSKALQRFNLERNKSIPQSRLNSLSSSSFSFNSYIRSPPKLRNLKSNKLGDSEKCNTNDHRNTNGAVLSSCAKNRNCLSCDVESTVEQSAGQTGATEKRGCVSQSFDYGLLPLNPAELFDENWSKCELTFDDFDCDFDTTPDAKKKVR